MRYPLPWFPLSDDPMRCISRIMRDYRECQSSLLEYRFSRYGNRRGIAFRLGCYERLGLRVCSCLGRCFRRAF